MLAIAFMPVCNQSNRCWDIGRILFFKMAAVSCWCGRTYQGHRLQKYAMKVIIL